LKTGLGSFKVLEMAPFDRSHTSSYSPKRKKNKNRKNKRKKREKKGKRKKKEKKKKKKKKGLLFALHLQAVAQPNKPTACLIYLNKS